MNLLKIASRAFQRVATRALTAGHRAASTGRRLTGWNPSNAGANTLIFSDGDLLRARSRFLVRENTWAASAVRSFVANAIGTGIKPQAAPGLPLSEQITKAWLRWTDEVDANGQQDLYGLQSQICRAVVQDGECFIRLRPRRITDKNTSGRRLTVPLQLQVIESDYVPLSETRELEGGGRILGGIEIDSLGRRTAYWMHRDHPGEGRFSRDTSLARIPADQILHIYRPDRPGQLRGAPWLTAAMTTIWELDQYVEASVLRAKLANLLSFFIKKAASDDNATFNETNEGDGTGIAGIQPGSVNYLEPGEEPVFNTPVVAGTEFQAFLRAMLRAVAAAIGVTYEQMTGDLEGVNYSSIRAGLLEFRRWCEAFQHQVMVFQLCRPLWEAWLQSAVLSGSVPVADYEKYLDVRWIAPGWPWVDPLKDLTAAKMAVRCGFRSRSGVISEQGEEAERIDSENQSDNARADSRGLSYDSDGRKDANGNSGPGGTEPADEGDGQAVQKKQGGRKAKAAMDKFSALPGPQQEIAAEMLADIIEGLVQ